jgi:hypothetical protein
MKRKRNPVDIDVVVLSQLVNTDRTEITPGSNIIGEDFKN